MPHPINELNLVREFLVQYHRANYQNDYKTAFAILSKVTELLSVPAAWGTLKL